MGKRTSTKRLSPMSDSASRAIDTKARKRIEELYELTDEIINAYNDVNDTYSNKVYQKYKQLQQVNKKLKQQLNRHHCPGCKCTIPSNEEMQEEEQADDDDDDEFDDDSENSMIDEQDQEYKHKEKSSSSSPTAHSIITRSRKKNPFIIADIEDTQVFDANDSRFTKNTRDTNNDNSDNNDGDNDNDDDDNAEEISMTTNQNENETTKDDNQSEHEVEEQVDNNENENENEAEHENENENENEAEHENENEGEDDDDGMARLPLTLQDIIRKKAKKNKNAKSYLLQISRYPALCEFLRDKSRTSFDHRPSENQVRPLIANHLSQHLANDAKIRMRLRDELREIHRSYMRTFMNDPHANGAKISFHRHKRLNLKKSPI
ncbi:unnamed protein product [Rotaria sp. Silwood2]|nr:unnamed protein product [Rotaria sp. Silwood2]CAF3883658.1 unnamed protein product [Rotaria sp. Silwood2]